MSTPETIDFKLSAIGKDRQWLADQTGYSYFSVRDCLAPNGKSLSTRMEAAFLAAIEREESARAAKADLPSRLALQPADDAGFRAWCRAYKASPHDTLEDWAIASLNDAATTPPPRCGHGC